MPASHSRRPQRGRLQQTLFTVAGVGDPGRPKRRFPERQPPRFLLLVVIVRPAARTRQNHSYRIIPDRASCPHGSAINDSAIRPAARPETAGFARRPHAGSVRNFAAPGCGRLQQACFAVFPRQAFSAVLPGHQPCRPRDPPRLAAFENEDERPATSNQQRVSSIQRRATSNARLLRAHGHHAPRGHVDVARHRLALPPGQVAHP